MYSLESEPSSPLSPCTTVLSTYNKLIKYAFIYIFNHINFMIHQKKHILNFDLSVLLIYLK